jgi:hypothetical protein
MKWYLCFVELDGTMIMNGEKDSLKTANPQITSWCERDTCGNARFRERK